MHFSGDKLKFVTKENGKISNDQTHVFELIMFENFYQL